MLSSSDVVPCTAYDITSSSHKTLYRSRRRHDGHTRPLSIEAVPGAPISRRRASQNAASGRPEIEGTELIGALSRGGRATFSSFRDYLVTSGFGIAVWFRTQECCWGFKSALKGCMAA